MSLRLNGSTSGYSEIDAPAIAGNNTLVLPTTNGSAHQLLKNSSSAGTLEYGVTLPSGNGLAHQLVKNSSSAGTWEYGFTLPSGNGLADQVLGGDGAGIISWVDRSRMVLETAQSATGTEVDFTDIPSWVKRITVMFNGVSTNGASMVLTQLGAGTIQITGYRASASVNATGVATVNSTTGFTQYNSGNDSASSIRNGVITFALVGSNVWVASGVVGLSDVACTTMIGGSVTLSGTLDRIRITTVNGTDTFDAGSINILYEG